MTEFPKPILLPNDIPQARKKRKRETLRAISSGIAIRLSIILIELFGFYWFASSALLMDAIASSFDIISSVTLIVCIRLASRPPDEDHPFGHGRYEPLIGLQLGLLLIVIGGSLVFQQGTELWGSAKDTAINPFAWIIPFLAAVLLECCYQFTIRVAKKEHCPALAADAIHYRIDGLTSLFATLALVAGAFFPHFSSRFDHVGAISIAFLMVGLGVYAARGNFHQLMDKIPDSNFFERVKKAALKVRGVFDTEKIRIQVYGPDAHVDIDIEVDPNLPVEAAHRISQEVRAEIQKEWPSVRDVTVHIEPYYPGDH